MNANQIIAEAMGLCWHNWFQIVAYPGEEENHPTFKCANCGAEKWGLVCKENTDYTTWEGFGKAWTWAKGQEWWLKFLNQNGWVDCPVNYIKASLIDPPVFAEALAGFLERRS